MTLPEAEQAVIRACLVCVKNGSPSGIQFRPLREAVDALRLADAGSRPTIEMVNDLIDELDRFGGELIEAKADATLLPLAAEHDRAVAAARELLARYEPVPEQAKAEESSGLR